MEGSVVRSVTARPASPPDSVHPAWTDAADGTAQGTLSSPAASSHRPMPRRVRMPGPVAAARCFLPLRLIGDHQQRSDPRRGQSSARRASIQASPRARCARSSLMSSTTRAGRGESKISRSARDSASRRSCVTITTLAPRRSRATQSTVRRQPKHVTPSQFALQNCSPSLVHTVHVKHALRDIEPYNLDGFHGCPVFSQLAPSTARQ